MWKILAFLEAGNHPAMCKGFGMAPSRHVFGAISWTTSWTGHSQTAWREWRGFATRDLQRHCPNRGDPAQDLWSFYMTVSSDFVSHIFVTAIVVIYSVYSVHICSCAIVLSVLSLLSLLSFFPWSNGPILVSSCISTVQVRRLRREAEEQRRRRDALARQRGRLSRVELDWHLLIFLMPQRIVQWSVECCWCPCLISGMRDPLLLEPPRRLELWTCRKHVPTTDHQHDKDFPRSSTWLPWDWRQSSICMTLSYPFFAIFAEVQAESFQTSFCAKIIGGPHDLDPGGFGRSHAQTVVPALGHTGLCQLRPRPNPFGGQVANVLQCLAIRRSKLQTDDFWGGGMGGGGFGGFGPRFHWAA